MIHILKLLKEWGTNLKGDWFKNIGPGKISAFILISYTILFGALLYGTRLITFTFHESISWLLSLGVAVIPAYFLTRFLIQKFVYRRIKLIYKLISETKSIEGTLESDPLAALDLDMIERDVKKWMDRKNAEIDHRTQMEQFRKDYIGNVSHELKTPVFNIQAYLQTLQDDAVIQTEPHASFLNKALKNALRLQEIIDDLSLVDKLDAKSRVLEFQNFDLREMTEEIFEELHDLAQQKNIKLLFKEGADDHFMVHADREYIRIALSNLVTNSIKYGKYNGFVKVSFYKLEGNLLVEVSDNGIGISEEHLPHVFDRFYRVDKGRSREQGGSGLGLSILKHIIESHEQKVHIRSKEGVGTTIGFTLNLAN